jgi:hypothetical protein
MYKLFKATKSWNYIPIYLSKSIFFSIFKTPTVNFSEQINILQNKNGNLSKDNNPPPEVDSISQYENNKTKAEDIIKIYTTRLDNDLTTDEVIKLLLLLAQFKIIPQNNLIVKIDKKLCKNITSMNEEQVSTIIYGFSTLKYKSSGLNFLIEKVMIKSLPSYSKTNFIKILKCLNKWGYLSKGMQISIRSYIQKNLNKFDFNELCDCFIYYPKNKNSFIKPNDEDKDMVNIIFQQIKPNLLQTDLDRLMNIYLLIYSTINKDLYGNINCDYDENMIDFFIQKEADILAKHVHMLIITHHFAKENINIKKSSQFLNVIYTKVMQCLNQFPPEEINTIIAIINSNKKQFPFDSEILFEINKSFADLCSKEHKDMSIDEIILYIQSLAMIIQNNSKIEVVHYNNALDILQGEVNRKINDFTITQFSNLLDLIHHFKEQLFTKFELDNITHILLKNLSHQTEKEFDLIFEDCYLIFLFLFDLKYRNSIFWSEYLKYLSFIVVEIVKIGGDKFSEARIIKLEKLNKMVDILKKEGVGLSGISNFNFTFGIKKNSENLKL